MISWRNWIASRPTTVPTPPNGDARPAAASEKAWPLRVKLLFWVTCALLPIAIVSILQSLERAGIDIDDVHVRLEQSARAAASEEDNLLGSGEQIARALSNISDVRKASPDCDGVLSDALIGVKYFANIARIDANGTTVCAALPLAKGKSAAAQPIFKAARTAKNFLVSGQIQSAVLHRPVIAGMLPLRDGHGKFEGVIAIALELHWLDLMVRGQNLPKGAVVFIYDSDGHILASNEPVIAADLMAHRSGAAGSLRTATDRSGDGWTFASEALRGGAINVAFAMRETHLYLPTYLNVGADFLMPILMIGLAWAGIWFATERQVNQWIAYLRRISAAYRSGHYAIRPQFENAPAEFKSLGDGLAEMAESIQDRDRKLREALNQKSLLIREIHHRVKNNLQIVMSLLSLQAGQLKDPAAREALMQAQVRINALALVHRILHEIEDQTTIDLKRLLHELAHQITEGMRAETMRVRVVEDMVDRDVSGDVAVPLALFVAEALTNIFKYAFAPGQEGLITISLKPIAEGRLRLTIADNGAGFDQEAVQRSGIGSRLIRTFGQQIGGVSSLQTEIGKGTTVTVEFRDSAAAPSEFETPARDN